MVKIMCLQSLGQFFMFFADYVQAPQYYGYIFGFIQEQSRKGPIRNSLEKCMLGIVLKNACQEQSREISIRNSLEKCMLGIDIVRRQRGTVSNFKIENSLEKCHERNTLEKACTNLVIFSSRACEREKSHLSIEGLKREVFNEFNLAIFSSRACEGRKATISIEGLKREFFNEFCTQCEKPNYL